MQLPQGYGLGRYDILFATNVLHATRNMAKTIQQCKTLLRKGGLLIANELSAKTPFLSLTFGLTEGWWLYDDKSRRIPGDCWPSNAVMSGHMLLLSGVSDASGLRMRPLSVGLTISWIECMRGPREHISLNFVRAIFGQVYSSLHSC